MHPDPSLTALRAAPRSVRRGFLLLLAAWLSLSLGGLFEPCASGAPQPLNVFIWSEYLDPEVVRDFEKQFNARLVIDLYEDSDAMLAKLQSGGAGLYDIVVPPDHMVPTMVKLGLLTPLRPDRLPNLKNLDPRFLNPSFDPGNKHSVPYQWGTVGVYYRKTPGKPDPDSWGVLLDPERAIGPFVLIDSMRDAIGAALKYRGHSLNSTDTAALKEVRDLLIAAKRRCVGMEGSVGGKNRVLAGTAAAAVVYNGEAARGISEDPGTAYFIPREGSQIWVDNLTIPAGAPNRDLAERFINFLLDAQVGARISNFTQFATPNRAAREFIRPEDLRNPTIYPAEEVAAKLEFLQDLGGRIRVYDQVWTQVKAR